MPPGISRMRSSIGRDRTAWPASSRPPAAALHRDAAADAPIATGRHTPTEEEHTLTSPSWVRDAVFYQIFPDRFARSARVRKPGPLEPWDTPPTVHGFKGGDLLGVVEHLGHLERLGINAI